MIPTDLNPLGTKSKTFISLWEVSAGDTIYLPLVYAVTNIFVDWGDGTTGHITDYTQNTHTYDNAGYYKIKIRGLLFGWNFNSVRTSNTKIRAILNWGDVGWGNLRYTLMDCSCSSVPNKIPNVERADYFFHGCALTTIDDGLLRGCTKLESIPYMFGRLYNLTNTELSEKLFKDCINLREVHTLFYASHLSGITISPMLFNPERNPNIESFYRTFYNCQITENVPELWNLYPTIPHGECFVGNGTASNWADIPDDWKGL